MAVPPIQQPFNYQARHLQLLEWITQRIDSGALGGGSGDGSSSADVVTGLDTSADIETIKGYINNLRTQLGDLAVLTANSQSIYDQLVLNGADNQTQTAAAIDASADVDAIIDRLDLLLAANQALPSSQFRLLQNYSYVSEVVFNARQSVAFAVPAGYVWEVASILCFFSTSNTAANRYLRLILSDGYGSPAYVDTLSPYAHTASQSLTYTYLAGVTAQPAPAGSPYVTLPLPKMILPEYHVLALGIWNYQSATPFDNGFIDGSVKLAVRQIPLV